MSGWVASLSEQLISNWELCKQRQLFGSGAPRAAGVNRGDTIYFWWAKHGLFARAQASSGAQQVTMTNFHRIPWPEPERYRYLIEIERIVELRVPYPSWSELNDIADLRGIPASQFPPVHTDRLLRVDALFDVATPLEYAVPAPEHRTAESGLRQVGVQYQPVEALKTSDTPVVFALDPVIQDRGTNGHRLTQNALATWLVANGLHPRSPARAPFYDVAWVVDNALFVAEVKSLTPENEKHQIRLGVGQVLEYAYLLDARPVLVLETAPKYSHWEHVLEKFGVLLIWNGAFERLHRSTPA